MKTHQINVYACATTLKHDYPGRVSVRTVLGLKEAESIDEVKERFVSMALAENPGSKVVGEVVATWVGGPVTRSAMLVEREGD